MPLAAAAATATATATAAELDRSDRRPINRLYVCVWAAQERGGRRCGSHRLRRGSLGLWRRAGWESKKLALDDCVIMIGPIRR